MNGNSILLDTNIVLYLLSGDTTISNSLFNKKLYVSFITQLELLGYQEITLDEQDKLQTILNDCIIIDINQPIKVEVINLKRHYKIKLPDAIICATTILYAAILITNDIRLKNINELKLNLIGIHD